MGFPTFAIIGLAVVTPVIAFMIDVVVRRSLERNERNAGLPESIAVRRAKQAGRRHKHNVKKEQNAALAQLSRQRSLASKAMRLARYHPDKLAPKLTDIGLLVYGNKADSTALYCAASIPDNFDYARPFAVFFSRRPVSNATMRFEMVDSNRMRRFVDESTWALPEDTETLVYPQTWMSVDNLGDAPGGEWLLRVYVDGQLMAVHEFRWRDEGGGSFRGYIDGDGEISDDLIAELSDVQLAPLSLDDLLGDDVDGLLN